MIYLSLSLGYVVCWLRNKGFSKIICIFILLLYGLVPFYANHSITFWKDPIFSASLSILTLYLYDLVISKGKIMHINKTFNIKFMFLLLIICFFRNNGVYILIILSLYLLILKN